MMTRRRRIWNAVRDALAADDPVTRTARTIRSVPDPLQVGIETPSEEDTYEAARRTLTRLLDEGRVVEEPEPRNPLRMHPGDPMTAQWANAVANEIQLLKETCEMLYEMNRQLARDLCPGCKVTGNEQETVVCPEHGTRYTK